MTQRYKEFADQLALAADVAILHMGVFDAEAGFFLETWKGIGAHHSASEAQNADADLPALTRAVQTIFATRIDRQNSDSHATQVIPADPFRIRIGKPKGHIYPVVAVQPRTDLSNKPAFDAFWPVALSFVAGHLEDLAGRKGTGSPRLIDSALRVLSVHFAVVDRNGTIDCSANLSNEWLAKHGGFEIDKERLVARADRTQKAFQQALRLATGPEKQSSIVSLRDESGPARLVWVSRLEDSEAPRALVILGRGRENAALREQLLKLSGLTVAERRVASHVLRGKSLVETAEATNLALSTVRSYMKRILAKTSTRRQSEFVSRYQGELTRIAIAPTEDNASQRP